MKKTKKYTKKQAIAIIDKAIVAFGLHENIKTDPQIIGSILEEIKLNDFKSEFPPIKQFFKKIVSKPQNLNPMIENIKQGLINKHPAIVEFAELALEKKWLKNSDHIVRSVHVAYILEALTAAMCNNHKFFIEVQNHFKTKERERGINSTHTFSTFLHALGVCHDLFGVIKYLSVDPGMIYFRTQRGLAEASIKENEAKKLLKAKKINYLEYKLLLPEHKNCLGCANELLSINIYEAGITEYKKGFKTNAISAFELSEDIKKNPPRAVFKNKSITPENSGGAFYKSIIQKENLFPVFEFSQDWVSLYITWNAAFVLSDLDDLDIILPKLFIPSIINTESENFLGARIISLWLTLNYIYFRKYSKKEVGGPKKKTEMAKAWAKINKKYAFDLAKRETHEDSKELMKGCTSFFSHPIFNLFKLVKVFLD